MSERMNKERAKQELERLKEVSKRFLEQNNFREFKNVVTDKSERIMIGKECFYLSPKVQQALDIAIESLQEDIQQKGIELMAKTIERKHYYPMPILFKNDDINKYTATEVNALIDSIADDIKKIVVEPYVRKE